MAKYEAFVEGDTNDADYVAKTTPLDETDLPRFLEIVGKIKAFNSNKHGMRRNWGGNEYHGVYPDTLSEEDIDWFWDYVPGGDPGVYVITEVYYYPMPEKIRLI